MDPKKSLYVDSISAFDEFDPVFEETLVRAMSALPVAADSGMDFPIEVHEVYGGWEIQANMPGVHPGDVFISVDGSRLKIQGVKRVHESKPPAHAYFKERAGSKFYRAVALPANVNPNSIYTCFEDGVLKIRLEH